MSYKGQVLRGEKWYHLMSEKELSKDKTKSGEVKVYLDSQKKIKEKK